FELDDKGVVRGRANTFGWLAAAVPGVPGGLQLALDTFGTRKFPEVVKPAIKFAADGFPVSKNVAAAIKGRAEWLAKDPGSAKLYFRNGQPLAEGETFKNPDLAALLRKLADAGRIDAFYKGDVADAIAAAFRKNGGAVTADD